MTSSWTPGENLNASGTLRRPDIRPDAKGLLTNGANAYLRDRTGARVGMWVNEISSDFELAGSSAQGPTRRDFYPHNFSQPSIRIKGQTTNNYEYNRLATFVRKTQLDALHTRFNDRVLTFYCVTPDDVVNPNAHNQISRGRHRPIVVSGFIPQMKRGATRFVTAHEYEFEFVILEAERLLGLEDKVSVPFQTMSTIGARLKQGRSKVKQVDPKTTKTTDDSPKSTTKGKPAPPKPAVIPATGVNPFLQSDLGLLPGQIDEGLGG